MLPGFRLHKLELLNWGTFDGNVFTVRPNGATTLLVGQNGSGKSTLVDALLTLLVRPGVRNFNVAAGAKKTERDERSYLKGAYDRGGDSDGQESHVKFLRPHPKGFTAILACFRNDSTDKAFTIAQLLYLGADQVDKVYCFADAERSIRENFGSLESTDGLLRNLRDLGWRATRTFADHEQVVAKAFHWKKKAMEVLNQTVAVKDIQRLNDFVRQHMLEPQSWGERVDQLLGHFAHLSEAHQSLVRVRQQFEQLTPIVETGNVYLSDANELHAAESVLGAVDAYWSTKTIELLTPEAERKTEVMGRAHATSERLAEEMEELDEQLRQIRNAMEQAGGPRLQMIPTLIMKEQAEESDKRKQRERYAEYLAEAGVDEQVQDRDAFERARSRLSQLAVDLERSESEETVRRDDAVSKRGVMRARLDDHKRELEGLNRRRENLPESYATLRERLCADLGIDRKELPFAAELIAVMDGEQEWTPAAEKVLRGFGLSMLVSERLYRVVSQYVDKTRLADSRGRGQRLVYLRVGGAPQAGAPRASNPVGKDSLLRKLALREGHSLLPWVRSELEERYDYQCCDSVEAFQAARGAAVTRNRHVKSGDKRHEKDDREFATDASTFVLGWDNREKKRQIASAIERLSGEEDECHRHVAALDKALSRLRERRSAVSEAARFVDFSDIHFEQHTTQIAALEAERRAIEESSEPLKFQKRRLEQTSQQREALSRSRDDAVGQVRLLRKEVEDARKLLKNAHDDLDRRRREGVLASQEGAFEALEQVLPPDTLTVENLFEQKDAFRSAQESRVSKLKIELKPVADRLTTAMNAFLRSWPQPDLSAGVDFVRDFLSLYQRISEDALPRLEERFKERLNEKVTQEIGLFREGLEGERRGVEEKIGVLNASLRKLEYRPGTYIQLRPRLVRDPEVVGFREKLRGCVEGSFDDTTVGNEARFLRIEDLLVRLRDEDNRRWRDKVTDVRRWFDFVAEVTNAAGDVVSRYEDSSGQSGGEKAKLAFTILVAAIAYQFDIDLENAESPNARDRFRFVVVDEMFSKVDDQHAEYALDLFKQFGLQLLIVAPLDAKARVTQPYVGCYLHVNKRENRSEIFEMTASEFDATVEPIAHDRAGRDSSKGGQPVSGVREGVASR